MRIDSLKLPERPAAILRLAALLCGIAFVMLPIIFAVLPAAVAEGMRIAMYLLWGCLALETVVQVVRMDKSARLQYLKYKKADWLFLLLSVIGLPASLATGSLLWCAVLFLKLPVALAPFNNEKVFQFIVNLIALLLIIIFGFPFLNVLAVSVSSPDQIVNLIPKTIDLYSVKYVLSDAGFFRSMGVSIFVTVAGTAISVFSMVMAAYPLSKPQMPFRRTIMMFFVIVMLFSGGMAPNILLMNMLGLNNTIWSLVFPSVVQVFYLILLKGFFEDVPAELEESARLDGANNFVVLFRIVLPVAAPMIATVAFFTMVQYWNNINNAILYLTSNQAAYPLPMYIRNFLNQSPMAVAELNPELLSHWDNVKMSYILFSIIPVLLAYPFSFRYLKNGVSMGAVKG